MNLADKLSKIQELLKAMQSNKTASQTQAIPSIKIDIGQPTKPNLTPASKKSPIKPAEQIQDPGYKDQRMKDAVEQIKINKNGQWEFEKGSFPSQTTKKPRPFVKPKPSTHKEKKLIDEVKEYPDDPHQEDYDEDYNRRIKEHDKWERDNS